MKTHPIRLGRCSRLVVAVLFLLCAIVSGEARPFVVAGSTFDLTDVTSNVDVYFTAMRYNIAAKEWDVNVTLSNKVAQPQSGPMLLVVDGFSGTPGPLRADGVSSNDAYFDMTSELPQGHLAMLQSSSARVISLGYTAGVSPHITTSVYALVSTNAGRATAFAQSQDQTGNPLPGVAVTEAGPGGMTNYITDPNWGVVTLGSAAGAYTWMFSTNGYLSVWRQAQLQSNVVTVLPFPRLAAISTQSNSFSPLSASAVTNEVFQGQFAAGAFSQNSTAEVTPLDGESLPFPLPQGWSPLQAFAIQFSVGPAQPLSIQLNPWGFISPSEQAALVQFNSALLTWQTLQVVEGSGTNAVSVFLPGSGTFALVAGDSAPIAPPPAVAGQALPASASAIPAATNLLASSTVTPTTSPASTLPDAVTGIAQVTVTNMANPLPSGEWFRGEITQQYNLTDGSIRVPQIFDTYFAGYQRPVSIGEGILQAQFGVRPLLMLDASELNQGTVHMDVYPEDAFSGGLFDTNGGAISESPIELLAEAGAVSRPEAIELRAVSPSNFVSLPGTNFTVAAAFEVGVTGVATNRPLAVQISGVASNSLFVLGQVVDQGILYGVTPVMRMHSDTNGNLFSDETNSDHLPGLTGSGQFVLLRTPSAEGLVDGIAENSSSQPSSGLPVSEVGLPWLVISGPGGVFKTLAPAGAQNVAASNTITGDTGSVALTMPTGLPTVDVTVGTGTSQLTVTSVTPSDNASNVPEITPIVINFSHAVSASTFESNSVELIENTNEIVVANATLNLAGTTATLLTEDQLDLGAQFQIVVSTNLTDSNGRALTGRTRFTFDTAAAEARDPAAQLIIYQPGATNLTTNILSQLPGYVGGSGSSQIVVQGTPGCADPDETVVIINESEGGTTTVTSQDDGSFLAFISGQEQDYLAATFFSQNGASLYVPVNRQIFDDGSVGLYQQGGSITATGDGGPVTVTVPPNAIQGRTVFKLNSITTNELSTQLGGVMPTNGVVAGSALNISITGQPLSLPLQASFPVDLTALGFPTNVAPTNVAAMVSVVQSNQNVTSYQVVDQLLFTPQTNQSQSQAKASGPSKSFIKPHAGGADQAASGFLNTSVGLSIGALGLPGVVAQIGFNQVLVPLLFGPNPCVVKGEVSAIPYDLALELQEAGILTQAISLQSGSNAVDVPIQIAQQMGLVNTGLVFSQIQQIVQVSSQIFQLDVLHNSAPLDGAFITLTLSGGPLARVPGIINPGMVYATSDSGGNFLMVAPAAGANYVVTASDPLYAEPQTQAVNPISGVPGQQGELSLSGAVYKDFYFTSPSLTQTTPTVSIANTPVLPGPGVPCQVIISATSPGGPPRFGVLVQPLGTNNLLTGKPDTNAQYTLSTPVITTNGNGAQWTATLTVSDPVTATLKVVVQPPVGTGTTIPYAINFSGPVPVTTVANIPPPDANDVKGPLVVETLPAPGGFVDSSDTVTVEFNKPIDPFVTNHTTGIVLSSGNNSVSSGITPVVRLSADQQTLSLEFPGLLSGTTYQLTLSSQSIRDLAGKPLDQIPSTLAADSFTTSFRTPAAVTGTLPGLVNGRGAVISGTQLYAIDQAPGGNYLDAYDISNPEKPVLESQLSLIGIPRDIAVAPQYHYKLNAQSSVYTNDLVAVVGGNLDAIDNDAQGETVTEPGQYLWVVNMGNPKSPQVLASPIVSYRVGSAVTKVVWAAPYFAYEENGSDIQMVGLVNLQEMVFGYNSTYVQQLSFQNGRPGVDLLGDGTYVDPGDTIPIPPTYPTTFFGNDQNYVLQGSTQRILDFSVTPGARTIGVTLQSGVLVDTNGVANGPAIPAAYRTLAFNGTPLNLSLPTDAFYPLTGAYPRWVTCFDVMPILINGSVTTIAAALVSLEPDTNGQQTLAVINITVPEQPVLLNKIVIPTSVLGGNIESVVQRSDGMIEVAGQVNSVIVNPLYLDTPAALGQLSPAITGVIPNAGTSMPSLGITSYGVQGVANGGNDTVVVTSPQLQFVSFPSLPIFDPSSVANSTDAALNAIMTKQNVLSGLAPAAVNDLVVNSTKLNQSDLNPPNSALHYYVLMYAPGGSGPEIDLGVESLNPSGRPLCNFGYGFAPVRAEALSTQQALGQTPLPCGAPIRSLPAYRLSGNPYSQYYNYYLSRPFALVTESLAASDVSTLQGSAGVQREILFSGAQLRAFIEPSESSNPVIGAFAGQVDPSALTVYPIANAILPTENRDYLLGPNPPAPGGSIPFEDTYGTIQAHSGELRTSDADISIPSPRMPITFIRTIGNQDNYNGPFGVGWDFNYNQRLTVLDPLTFPTGLQMPLVIRDTAGDSDIAGSQDVLFNNGEGQIYHFIWEGTNMPAEFAQDPLVADFDYADLVSDYYLPQHGCFDLLVKYKDGRFERVTPAGVRYRYNSTGRLEYIYDRFPQNWQYLTYDVNNWLVRIDDYSVSSPRNVQVGYYRSSTTDPSYTSGLDTTTSNPYVVGKIYQLMDYTGRNVLFSYDTQGELIEKDGIQVGGENGGYSGRAHIYYSWQNCKLTGVTATTAGIPYVQANNAFNTAGAPVAQQTTGSMGTNQITVPQNNAATSISSEQSSVKIPDGTSIQHTFDKWGNVTQTSVVGTDGQTATEVMTTTSDGLRTYKQFAEGNSESMSYDSNNIVFRSRGNLLTRTVATGPRGGVGFTESFNYDPRYNLQSGAQVNADGFTIDYTLTSDGRAVQEIDYGTAGTKTMTYNDNGQVTGTTDENGTVTTTDYDSSTAFIDDQTIGNITYQYGYDTSIPSQLGKQASITPPLGDETDLTYNNNLQPVEMVRGGYTTTSAYDELGRAILAETELDDGTAWSRNLSYDSKSFLTNSTLNGVEVDGALTSLTTTFAPDAQQRVKTVTDPNGTIQTYTYDSRGNVIQSVYGDYTNTFTYDLNNNPLTETHAGSLVRTVQYDGLDHAINVIYHTAAADYTDTRTYYASGAINSDMMTDPSYGVAKNFTYDTIDALGRHLSTTIHGTQISPQFLSTYAPLQTSVKGPLMTYTTTFDTTGNEIGYNDPNETMVLQRDAAERVQESDHQQIGATYSQFFAYDGLDHQTSVSDLLGPSATFEPRSDGKILQTTDANKSSVSQTYTSLGEITSRTRSDGMESVYRYNKERQVDYQGDPDAGFDYTFDSDLRETSGTLRDGAAVSYSNFDPNNMPTAMALPGGGTETLQYDLQQRLLQRKVSYQNTTWEENYTYDALGRVRGETYQQNGGPNNSATFDFDPAGPMTAAHFTEDNATYNVGYSYYSDANLQKLTYPSGAVVTESRDSTGRLTGLADTNGNIINALSWQGNGEPKVVDLGATMVMTNQYDKRGRLTASVVSRISDGKILMHMVYQLDAANNPLLREYVHRGGIADEFSYDAGERLSQADVQVRITNSSGSGGSLYQRSYNYHQGGLDYLTSVLLTGFTNAPPFGSNWTSHDDFLQPTVLDGYSRGQADPMGNVTAAKLWTRPAGAGVPQPVGATFQHDGLGHLVTVTLTNGMVVQNEFQASDLRFGRTVTQNGQVVTSTGYVYDNQSHLIEEYDRTGSQPVLIARYYYGSGDAPVAADILNTNTAALQRFYYLKDNSQSVVAVVDAAGNNVERVWYDPFGQAVISTPSASGPAVTQVAAGANGSLIIGMSEAVESPFTDPGSGSGDNVVSFNNSIPQSIIVKDTGTGTVVAGTVTMLNSSSAYAPFTTLQFTPNVQTTNAVTISLAAGTLADEWGNTNIAWSKEVTNSQGPGTIYYQSGAASSGQTARSSIGSPFLFQGQYFDYDTGLLYLRARFYDAYAGMFTEPDPLGYADSVNHYAAFGNNPVKLRDPLGLSSLIEESTPALERLDVHPMVIEMARKFAPEVARIGIGANELITILNGPMLKAIKEGTPVEFFFRSFKNNAVRLMNAEMGFQGKPMWVYLKTDPITGLTSVVTHWGEHPYNSDIDFVMITENGQPTDLATFNRYAKIMNQTHEQLNPHMKAAREAAGHSIVEGEPQLMVMHGATLYLPWERAQSALGGDPKAVTADFHAIGIKMKDGIGACSSIAFDPQRGIIANENVNIGDLTARTVNLARDILINRDSGKFDQELSRGFQQAAAWEGDTSGNLFPEPLMRTMQLGNR